MVKIVVLLKFLTFSLHSAFCDVTVEQRLQGVFSHVFVAVRLMRDPLCGSAAFLLFGFPYMHY